MESSAGGSAWFPDVVTTPAPPPPPVPTEQIKYRFERRRPNRYTQQQQHV